MHEIDLAVVGGGFAGMACGAAAAARGVQTVVIDRKSTPGSKPHTTGILVKEVADAWDVPRHLTRKIAGVRLYAPGGEYFDLHSPGYYFLATDTPGVLRWLAQRAIVRGASVHFGQQINGLNRQGDRWLIQPTGYLARWVVGADGACSAIARHSNLGTNSRFLVGVEAEFQNVSGVDDDHLHVFVDSQLAPGYIAWVVPGVGQTQVGIACKADRPPQFNQFIRRISSRFDFSAAVEVSRRRGLIPIGGLVHPQSREGVMLIGDAAGMVSPLTAGGIHTALQYGRLAGVALADHLLDDGPDPAKTLAHNVKPFGIKQLMRWAIDLHPPNSLLDVMLRLGPVRGLVQTVFYHHRGLMTRAAWRDLAAGCFGQSPNHAS